MTDLRNLATLSMSEKKEPMKIKETKRTFVDTKGNSWEWTETPEVINAIKKYWDLVQENSNAI